MILAPFGWDLRGAVALRRMLLAEIWRHGLAGAIKSRPLALVRQRRDGDGFAAVEAHQRRIHQFARVHDTGDGVHVMARTRPNFRARGGG